MIAQTVWATVNPISKGKRGELFSNLIFQRSQNSTAVKLEETTTSTERQWAVYLEVGPWLRVWKNWRIPRTGETSWTNWLLQTQAGYWKSRDAFSLATRHTFSWVFCAIQTLSNIMKKSAWISLDLVEHVCQKTVCKGPGDPPRKAEARRPAIHSFFRTRSGSEKNKNQLFASLRAEKPSRERPGQGENIDDGLNPGINS